MKTNKTSSNFSANFIRSRQDLLTFEDFKAAIFYANVAINNQNVWLKWETGLLKIFIMFTCQVSLLARKNELPWEYH